MNTIHNLISDISLRKESKWIVPALMALALLTVILGVTGCSPPHH